MLTAKPRKSKPIIIKHSVNLLHLWFNVIKVRVRKIGGSVGLIIPKDGAKSLNLKENEEVLVEIRRPNPLQEMFGAGKFSKPAKELIREARRNTSKYW